MLNKRLISLSSAIVLSLSALTPALAGGYNQMVNVSQPAVQECPACNDAELKAKLDRAMSDLKTCERECDVDLQALRQENDRLNNLLASSKTQYSELNDSNQELASSYRSLQARLEAMEGPQHRGYVEDYSNNVLGSVIATPLGAVFGTVRGGYSKGADWATELGDELGDNALAQFVGKTIGLPTGIVAGTVTGFARGIHDGVVVGYDKPLSAESFSLAGDMVNDYDPFDFNREDDPYHL
jgi:hypothetical protein